MSGRQRSLASLRFLGMALVALVVAHNLEFIVAFGPGAGAMMARTGHGREWTMAVAIVVGGAIAFLGLASWRLARMGIAAKRLRASDGAARPATFDFGRSLLALWPRITVAAALLFVAQENLEHASAGLPLPGLAAIGSSEYPHAGPVIAAVSLAVAFVGLLFRRQSERLAARIAAARRQVHPLPIRHLRWSPLDLDRRPELIVGRRRQVGHLHSGRSARSDGANGSSAYGRRVERVVPREGGDAACIPRCVPHPTGGHPMRHRRLRIIGAMLTASLFVPLAAGPAAAHVIVQAGTYSLAIGWAHEPTYVGQVNAVQVIITDAAGTPVDDLTADDLKVVVSTGGQQSASLVLEPFFDADTGLGIHGDYEASIMPTAPGDYTFHVTGSIHGTAVDDTETSSDETFNSAIDESGIQFPAQLPTMAEVVTRLDRIDARASASPNGPTQASVDAAASAAATAGSSADRALWIGGGFGVVGLLAGVAGLLVATRRSRSQGS